MNRGRCSGQKRKRNGIWVRFVEGVGVGVCCSRVSHTLIFHGTCRRALHEQNLLSFHSHHDDAALMVRSWLGEQGTGPPAQCDGACVTLVEPYVHQ